MTKLAAFRPVLAAAERLYRESGNDAHALSRVATLFAGRDAMTVAAFAAMLAKVPADVASDRGVGAPAGAATVGELQIALSTLATFCAAAGAKAAAKDLKALADALVPHTGKAVDDFCARVNDWLRQEAERSKARKTPAKKSAVSNEEAISAYLSALRRAGTDRAAFEAALTALKADKSLKSPGVAEIARRYANTVTKYKSMAAAHADIASAFTQQARFANKVG
jgi:hypothetical protein